MSLPQWIIAAVVLQRLAELVLSRRNTARLLANSAVEVGARHYPFIVAVHAGWLGALFFLTPNNAPMSGLLLSLFLLLQIGRVWVIVTLGTRWTTRVIVLPNTPLVKHGPYRWLKHPNYLIVCAEIAVLPLIFGQWQIALFFSLANFLVLFWRIRIENETLENTVSK
jgi:methyltransferase